MGDSRLQHFNDMVVLFRPEQGLGRGPNRFGLFLVLSKELVPNRLGIEITVFRRFAGRFGRAFLGLILPGGRLIRGRAGPGN